MVRFRVEVVGAARRTVHFVQIPDGIVLTQSPETAVLIALCGQRFQQGEVERLGKPIGMPCEDCLFLLPGPRKEPVPDDSPVVLGPRPRLVPGLFRVSA